MKITFANFIIKRNVLPEPLKVTHKTYHSLNNSGLDKGKQLNKTLLTTGFQCCVGRTVIVHSFCNIHAKCRANMKYIKLLSFENSWKSTFTCTGKNNNKMELRKIDW
jgi:hypothetical protein